MIDAGQHEHEVGCGVAIHVSLNNRISVAFKPSDAMRNQSNGCEQKRWAYLFKEGLIDKKIANDWADEAWPPEPDEAISETGSA